MIVVMTMLYCHFTCFNWLGLKALKLVALSGGRLGGGVGGRGSVRHALKF